MFDCFEDALDGSVSDSFGNTIANFHPTGAGSIQITDSLGMPSHYIHQNLDGNGFRVTDSINNIVSQVHGMSGGGFQMTNTVGNTVATMHAGFSGATLFNTLNQPLMNFDPCGGGITNAMGALVGRFNGF